MEELNKFVEKVNKFLLFAFYDNTIPCKSSENVNLLNILPTTEVMFARMNIICLKV